MKSTATRRRRRYELGNRQWERIRPLLPHRRHKGGPGRPWRPHRRLIHGILWVLHTGAPGRDVPARYGPWQTVYDRFNRWRQDGTWTRLATRLLGRLDRQGRSGRDLGLVDATSVRASRAAAGARKQAARPRRLGGSKATQLDEPADHALGRSRGGFGTKVHRLCQGHGVVRGLYVRAGPRQESSAFEPLRGRVALPRRPGVPRWPRKLAADKGYRYPGIRRWLRRRRVEPVIPTHSNQPREEDFDKVSYRKRGLIECGVGWFKECRRLGTRYEKLAVHVVAFWLVALIEKLLRLG